MPKKLKEYLKKPKTKRRGNFYIKIEPKKLTWDTPKFCCVFVTKSCCSKLAFTLHCDIAWNQNYQPFVTKDNVFSKFLSCSKLKVPANMEIKNKKGKKKEKTTRKKRGRGVCNKNKIQ